MLQSGDGCDELTLVIGKGSHKKPANRKGKQPRFAFMKSATTRINRYLQALLTKSEIELKLSQCKIQ
jgi:hypothetical protein